VFHDAALHLLQRGAQFGVGLGLFQQGLQGFLRAGTLEVGERNLDALVAAAAEEVAVLGQDVYGLRVVVVLLQQTGQERVGLVGQEVRLCLDDAAGCGPGGGADEGLQQRQQTLGVG